MVACSLLSHTKPLAFGKLFDKKLSPNVQDKQSENGFTHGFGAVCIGNSHGIKEVFNQQLESCI